MKKTISLILIALLMINIVPISSLNIFADTLENEEIIIEKNNGEVNQEDNNEEIYNGIIENPIYKGQDIEEIYSPLPVERASTPTFTSVKEAVKYVKAQMVKRSGIVKFTIKNNKYYDKMPLDIINAVMVDEKNGNSSEGDYLNRHWSNAEWMVETFYSDTINFTFNIKYLSTYYQEQQVNAEVNKVLDELNVYDKDEFTKAKVVHDYIVENITYDYGLKKFSAYNGIINKNVVCNGFASLTYKMMKELKVDVRCITGYSSGEYHAWNICKIGSFYYNVDNTWDSCYTEDFGNLDYSWFLKNNNDFWDHSRDNEFKTAQFNSIYPMSKTSYKLPDYYTFKLNKVQKTIVKGKTYKLEAYENGGISNKIQWTSSNEKIATVDSKGVVKGIGIGTTTIIATSQSGLTATCTIRVKYNTSDCTTSSILNYTYSGKTIKPKVTVYYKGKTLKEGQDYLYEYGKNTSIGSGSFTIIGMGDYSGSKKLTFKILPGKISGFKQVDSTTSSIKLSWSKMSSASGYRIYRANSKNGKYTRVATMTKNSTTTFTNSKLSKGKTYYYKIRAYKIVGKNNEYGPYSSVITTSTKCSTPSISVKSIKSKNAKISWNKIYGAHGYRVYRASSKKGSYSRVATVSNGSTLSFTDKSVKKGKVYYYKIRAYRTVNGSKNFSSYSSVKYVKVR